MAELTAVQIGLIIALIVIGGGGFLNMQRIKKKKLMEEKMMLERGMGQESSNLENPSNDEDISPAEQNAKSYIEQYKNSYPRESIKQALLGAGNSEADVDRWLDKYM